jgi:AraC-like DNA-binding protein
MNKPKRLYEPHLALREVLVPPGGEWLPEASGWSVVRVGTGAGFCLRDRFTAELEAGSVLLLAAPALARIRAGRADGLQLHAFTVIPSRLHGLVTPAEQEFFRAAASREESVLRVFRAQSPLAVKVGQLFFGGGSGLALSRLQLLQLFVEAFGRELHPGVVAGSGADAKERLRTLLKELPQGKLLEMDFNDLARMTRCTSRHFSRIFREVVGAPFRDRRAEARLERACQLLATTRCKVVEVALESGFNSLSLFNLMFTRRFETSPGRWRRQHGLSVEPHPDRSRRTQRFAICRKDPLKPPC